MFNSGHIINRQTGLALTDANTYEFTQSEFAAFHSVDVQISAPSSLVGGALTLQEYDPLTQGWANCPAEYVLIASGGGTPAALDRNTASATVQVGGIVKNADGLKTITNTATVKIECPGNGKKKRLKTNITSGSATLGYSYVGQRNRNF